MTPVKINLFISCDDADGKYRDTLRDWLYPMRDEVNIWPEKPPPAPTELSLPWQLLLFWYTPPNQRYSYDRIVEKQKERAHIYLFLTSYKSLVNNSIQGDISLAVNRRIGSGDDLNPLVFPVVLSPSHWKQKSGLAGYKPIGPKKSIAETKPVEEGYLQLTDQLAQYIKVLQRRLTEERFYQSRLVQADPGLGIPVQRAQPYLGDDDEATEMSTEIEVTLPEWLGWAIIVLLAILTYRGLHPPLPLPPSRYQMEERPVEYPRTIPPVPSKEPMVFPPPD